MRVLHGSIRAMTMRAFMASRDSVAGGRERVLYTVNLWGLQDHVFSKEIPSRSNNVLEVKHRLSVPHVSPSAVMAGSSFAVR